MNTNPRGRRRPRVRLVALLCALPAAFLCGACRNQPVTDRDREALLGVRDLAPYGVVFNTAARHETFEKTRFFDGSTELNYEFRLPDDWRGPGVYLMVTASVEKDKSAAAIAHGSQKIGMGAAAKLDGDLEYVERAGFFPHGDESTFYVLKSGGRQIGQFYITRYGPRVYSVFLTGLQFYEPEAWGALVKPKLENFAAYNP